LPDDVDEQREGLVDLRTVLQEGHLGVALRRPGPEPADVLALQVAHEFAEPAEAVVGLIERGVLPQDGALEPGGEHRPVDVTLQAGECARGGAWTAI
jgi:hypothetical protein